MENIKTSQDSTTSTDDEDDTHSTNGRRGLQCGDFCSFNIFKIPGLLLRNMVIPKENWDDFPNGFDRLADRIVFQPRTNPLDTLYTPESFQITDQYEEVFFTTKDKVKLHAYLIKCTSPCLPPVSYPRPCYFHDANASTVKSVDQNQNEVPFGPIPPGFYSTLPTLIYFHGNAGNIGMCCSMVKEFKHHPVLAKLNWFLVEYRGYGKSEGKEREKGLYEDAKAALRYIEARPDLDSQKIVIMGHSMGGAVAIHLASHHRYKRRIAALITENTFTSIPEVAKKMLDNVLVNYLPHCFYSCTFKSIDKVGKVKCPSMFICADQDDIVPWQMSEDLYKKCGADIKYVAKMERCGHNDAFTSQDFMPRVAKFLEEVFNQDQANNTENDDPETP